jgi:hypothetical protein
MGSHSLELQICLKFMIFQHHRVLQTFIDRTFNSIQNVFAVNKYLRTFSYSVVVILLALARH